LAIFNLANNMQSWCLQRCFRSSGIAENIRPFTDRHFNAIETSRPGSWIYTQIKTSFYITQAHNTNKRTEQSKNWVL